MGHHFKDKVFDEGSGIKTTALAVSEAFAWDLTEGVVVPALTLMELYHPYQCYPAMLI